MFQAYTLLSLACLVLLPNMDLINYLVIGTPLVAWKQLIATVLWVGFFPILGVLMRRPDMRFVRRLFPLVIVMLVVMIIAILFSISNGIKPYRLMFGLVGYAGFFPLVLLPFLLLRLRRPDWLISTIVAVGVVSGLGLVLDYSTELLKFIPRTGEITRAEKDLMEVKRASFLFGAPTNIYPTLSLAMAMMMCRAIDKDAFFYKFRYFFLIAILFVGLIFTGSRSQVTVALILLMAGSVGWMIYSKDRIFGIFVLLIAGSSIVFATTYGLDKSQKGDYLYDRYKSAFERESAGNDVRYKAWEDGVELIKNWPISSVGKGLGITAGQVEDGSEIEPHYESSLFQAYAEAGVFGMVIRYAPGVFALFFLVFTKTPRTFLRYILQIWIITYFASIFSAPTASAYHVQASYYVVVGLSACWPFFDRTLRHKRYQQV